MESTKSSATKNKSIHIIILLSKSFSFCHSRSQFKRSVIINNLEYIITSYIDLFYRATFYN